MFPKTVARTRGMMVGVANGGVKSTYVTPTPEERDISQGSAKQGFSRLLRKAAVGIGSPPPHDRIGVLARIAGTTAMRTKSLNILLRLQLGPSNMKLKISAKAAGFYTNGAAHELCEQVLIESR